MKDTFDENVLNQAKNKSKIQSKITHKVRMRVLRRRIAVSAASLVMVFALGFTLLQKGLVVNASKEVSIVAIDINPSFQLSVDANNIVLKIKAMNKDAKSLNVSGLIGKTANEATQAIIQLSIAGGFLKNEDLVDDYVLVTTINTDVDRIEATETLHQSLKDIILAGGDISGYHVVMMKANKIELFEAQGKKVPIGLYVINGMIQHDGVWLSAGEYFSNPENKKNLDKRKDIIKQSTTSEKALIQRFIDKLEKEGVVVAAFRTRLANPNENLEVLKADIQNLWDSTHKDSDINSEKGKPEMKGKPANPGNSKK